MGCRKVIVAATHFHSEDYVRRGGKKTKRMILAIGLRNTWEKTMFTCEYVTVKYRVKVRVCAGDYST